MRVWRTRLDIPGPNETGPVFLELIGTLTELAPRDSQKFFWRPHAEKVFTGASGPWDTLERVPRPIHSEKRTPVAPRVQDLWPFENPTRKPYWPPSGIFLNRKKFFGGAPRSPARCCRVSRSWDKGFRSRVSAKKIFGRPRPLP